MVMMSNLRVSLTKLSIGDLSPRAQSSHGHGFSKQQTSHQLLFVSDSSGMWEEHEEEEAEDDDEEDEGLAGQLLSDLIASNKYGTSFSPVSQLFPYFVFNSAFFSLKLCSCLTDDDYYEDDEEDDPDALKDPIYQIDLQVH